MGAFASDRYDRVAFRRCGSSGLKLPAVSLGGWNNFEQFAKAQQLMTHAFDRGITHFDFANNYGPPPGIAEEHAGRVLRQQFAGCRDELIISTKAGYDMWPGPYGDGGSKKYLTASLDQSLRRLQLDYVDIFYIHRFDPDTPLEETMESLHQLRMLGKALYIGFSNYNEAQTSEAFRIIERLGTRPIVHQSPYSMLNRTIERGVTQTAERLGMGMIVFSPLEQGLLSDKYLAGVPEHSRAGRRGSTLSKKRITPELVEKLHALNRLSAERGHSLARLALKWATRHPAIASVLIGASQTAHIDDSLRMLDDPQLTEEEIRRIEAILR